jgi:hypothetical protein
MNWSLVSGADFRRSLDWARKQPRLLPMKILQPAKFALLYENQRKAVIETSRYGGCDSSAIVNERVETPLTQPATVEVNGVLLMSASPKSAAEAARINEKLKEAAEMLPLAR